MPNIPVYADNTTYVGFLKLSDEVKTKLKEDFIKAIQGKIKE